VELLDLRSIANGLNELAGEILTHDRIVDTLTWYYPGDGHTLRPAPIVPRAIHNALCVKLSAVLHDEREEIVICDRCQLAVEYGAQ